MDNPSEANDEGITALHNSICAGHFDIVKFLIEFGCDVNAADTDGWLACLCFCLYQKVHNRLRAVINKSVCFPTNS